MFFEYLYEKNEEPPTRKASLFYKRSEMKQPLFRVDSWREHRYEKDWPAPVFFVSVLVGDMFCFIS